MPMATTNPTARKTPPAGPARSRFKNQIPTTATKALVHHTRKKGISNRHESLCEEDEFRRLVSEERQERNRQSDDDGSHREAECGAADVGRRRRVHRWGC
jgi:hypothetical protein